MRSIRPVRVLLCDDERALREIVRAHWEGEDRIMVVAEASDGVEGVVAAARLQPAVILLDWHMPRLTGIEALPLFKQVAPHAAVVMWSSNVSAMAEATAEPAAVDCFLEKTAALEELTAAALEELTAAALEELTAAALEELTAAVLATADQRDATPPLGVLLAHTAAPWRAQVRTTLDRVGARVHEVDSAEQAVDVWRTHQPSVALVERKLIDALSLAERGAVDGPAMIVIDEEFELEEALAALESGTYDDLLIDPSSPSEIASRVRSAGDAGRLRDQVTSTAARLAQLTELSQTDELTGLPNRRSLLEQLTARTSSARRHRRPLAIALLDIDRFKDINDAHGHQAGDEVLREVGRRLASRVREEDVVGRLGGDEFVALLAEVDRRGATTVAEALRDAVERRPVPIGGNDLCVNVSVGWAVWQGENDEELLERADRALYAAKHARGDRIGEATAPATDRIPSRRIAK